MIALATIQPWVVPTHDPMRPSGLGWLFVRKVPTYGSMADAWWHAGADAHVLSTLDMAQLPRSGGVGPQWHVSITDCAGTEPRRPSLSQVRLTLCAFGMLAAEEDNHHPGNARHFWMPVDPSERVDCECKSDEVVVTEDDGYQWTNPTDGPCRGCENERVMAMVGLVRPCPIHTRSAVALTEA